MRDELEVDIHLIQTRPDTQAKKLRQSLLKAVRSKNTADILTSFLVYLLSFSFIYFTSKEVIHFNGEYFAVLGYFILSLVLGASFSQKFKSEKTDKYVQVFRNLYLSAFTSLLTLIIVFPLAELNAQSRQYVLTALFSGLIIESFYFVLSNKSPKSKTRIGEQLKLAAGFIVLDGLILSFFLYLEVVSNITSGRFPKQELLLIVVVYLSWLISAAATHKFVPTLSSMSRMNAFEMQVKFYLRIITIVALAMILLQLDTTNVTNFIRGLVGYAFLSSLLFMLLFAEKIKNKNDEATVVFLKAYEMKDAVSRSNGKNGNGKYIYNNSELVNSVETNNLQFEYFKEYGESFSILDTILDLKSFNTDRTLIINSDKPMDMSSHPVDSYQLVTNLQVLNDQYKLNEYLLDIRRSLVKGGVFVGALLPHHYRYQRYLNQYSFYRANVLYFFDFVWKRVMPKLPVTREIYATFSKEKDRALSLAEGLGRLVYCGFKVLDLVAVDNVVYFAAVKKEEIEQTNKFFYSPIFKMKRVGKGGKPIYVYKLRTMYPYSEFIQDFVFKHNNLEPGGKFKDDFRVPVWGRLFRKLWIDELPMLLNWVKRDLKFVGVRPISNHYLSLYSKEHQERRKNFKPGLIPPYYADMPKTIEEIELSEKRYFDAYEKHPVKTDFKYFIKSVNNILIRKKRSA